MRIAIDLDGVIINWNTPFAHAITQHTGILFPTESPDFPSLVEWPRSFGVTATQEAEVVAVTMHDPQWWLTLPLYDETESDLALLADLAASGHEILFLTKRPSQAHIGSGFWLTAAGYPFHPTVITTETRKGVVCHALEIDCLIDDRVENLDDVIANSPKTRVYLLDRPWNRIASRRKDIVDAGGVVVGSVAEFLEIEGLITLDETVGDEEVAS